MTSRTVDGIDVPRVLPDSDRETSTSTPRWGSLLGALLVLLLTSTPVLAGVLVENRMSGSATTESAGLVILDPNSGSHLTVVTDADWSAGIHTGTTVDGGLKLSHRGDVAASASPAWWDSTFGVRRCYTVNNPGDDRVDYAYEFTYDTASAISAGELRADGGDLRAVDSSGNEIPLWLEGPVPSNQSTVWVQIPDLVTGANDFCLYHGNPTATSVSDEFGVFTSNRRWVRYYTGTDYFTNVTLISYVDGNNISINGGTPSVLNKGQTMTVASNRDTVIDASGPISGSSAANATDTIIPESFADTEFAFPINRGQQRIYVRAPFGATNIEFLVNGQVINSRWIGGATATSHTITPGDAVVPIIADAGARAGVVVRSTNGVPFLAAHTSASRTDSVVGVPWTGDPLYGVPTNNLTATAGSVATGFTYTRSNGAVAANTAQVGSVFSQGAWGNRGNSTGLRIDAGQRIAANSYADANGSESTSFWPESILESTYMIPLRSSYVTMACPTAGQTITRTNPNGTTALYNCVGAAGAPGFAYTGLTTVDAGTTFSSSEPFFLMAEKWGTYDEMNVLGANATRPPTNIGLTLTAGPLEGLYLSNGTWTSPTYDTGSTGVFGVLKMLASLPASTNARLQIATGDSAAAANAAPTVGPDGTAGTWFVSGTDSLDPSHDFDQFVRFVIELETNDPLTTPVVSSVDLTFNLSEFAATGLAETSLTIQAGPGLDSHLLVRYYGSGTLSYDNVLAYRSGTNLPAVNLATIRTDEPADHVRIVSGSIAQGQGTAATLGPQQLRSVYLDEDIVAGQTVTMTVSIQAIGSDGVILEHDLNLELQS